MIPFLVVLVVPPLAIVLLVASYVIDDLFLEHLHDAHPDVWKDAARPCGYFVWRSTRSPGVYLDRRAEAFAALRTLRRHPTWTCAPGRCRTMLRVATTARVTAWIGFAAAAILWAIRLVGG